MSKLFNSVTRFFQDDRKVWENNKNEISQRNLESLCKLSSFFFFIMVAYFVFMHFRMRNDQLDILYLSFLPVFALVMFFSRAIDLRQDMKNRIRSIRILTWSYIISIMAFIIVVSFYPYPEKPSIYFPPMLICLSVAFTDRYDFTVLFEVLSFLSFNISVTFMKYGDSLIYDRYGSVMALIGAIAVSAIVARTRDSEFKSKDELRKYVSIDPLTDQLNKSTIERLCKEYLLSNKGKESSIMMMFDIDYFKKINDDLGHKQGDYVLEQIGHLLGRFFSDSGYVGRFGGDEFLILLKGTDNMNKLQLRLDTLMSTFGSIYHEYAKWKISCSIGIALNKDNNISYSMMLYRSDSALYDAKNNGKSQYSIFQESLDLTKLDKPLMLIADDAEVSRSILSNVFKDEFSIIQAEDGNDALSLMEKYQRVLSVVLLDWMMPHLDGKGVLMAVRKKPEIKAIPIVVITGDESIELEALRLGAIDYITKPFDGEVIRLRVRNSMRTII